MGDMADYYREGAELNELFGGQEGNDISNDAEAHDAHTRGCGGVLVERVNRTTGETFWGCSEYLDCRYTQNRRPDGSVK